MHIVCRSGFGAGDKDLLDRRGRELGRQLAGGGIHRNGDDASRALELLDGQPLVQVVHDIAPHWSGHA